jgi:sulfite exporter TauE/SafE
MIELPLVFLSGILGSSHCLGMCGPFAVAIGSRETSLRGNLARQSIYSAGRIFTYAFLGAAAGYFGQRLGRIAPQLVWIPAMLALTAGALLTYEGLRATGLFRRGGWSGGAGCLAGSLFAPLLRMEGGYGAFLAGLATGFLPCGLVYAFLALAAGSGGMIRGMAVMACFGAGTVPLMAAAGCGASLLTWKWRPVLYRVAGFSVVAAGMISMARGVGALPSLDVTGGSGCPFCP